MMEKANGRSKSAKSILSDLLNGQADVPEDLSRRLLSLIEGYEEKLSASTSLASENQDGHESLTGMIAPYLAEGLVLVHMDTAEILYGNPRLYEMYGWRPGELIGKPVSVLNSPNGQEPKAIARQIISGVQQEGRWQDEILGVRKDGSEFWVLVSAAILDHPEFGRVQVSTQLDINERKQSEMRYRALFDNNPDSVTLLSTDGIVLDINEVGVGILGYERDEIIGKHTKVFASPREQDHLSEVIAAIKAGDAVPRYERVILRKDGTERIIEVHLSVVRDDKGEISHWQSISRDITERKRSEARFRALMDRNNDGVLFIDLEGKITAANPKAAELSGWSVEEMVGMEARKLIADREAEDADRRHEQLVDGADMPVYERVARRKDGTEYVIEVNASMVYDSSGDPLHVQLMFRDISARKRSERQYRALFDQVQDSVILYDTEGIIIAANEQAGEMIGYPLDELVGMQIRNLIAEREVESMQDLRERLMAGETIDIFERVATRSDGTEYHVEIDMSLVTLEEGKAPYIQSIVRDITDRKQEEARFRALFDRNNDAVLLLDMDGRIIAANPMAVEITGYSQAELLAMHAWDLVVQTEVGASRGRLAELMQNVNLPFYERVSRRKSGEEYVAEIGASLVVDAQGKPLHIQTMFRDISERKASELRYRALFENTHDAIFIIDLDGRNLMTNQQAARMLGYSVEELIGTHVEDLVPEREAPDAVRRRKMLLAGEALPTYERVARRKDGTEILIEVSAALVRDANGDPLHIQTVFRDITERKQTANRYRALLEANQDSVVIFGLDGIILEANEQAAKMTGYSREELVGMSARTFVSPVEYEHLGEVQKRLLAGETLPRYQRIGVRKDGSEFIMEINMTVVRDEHGEPSHWQSISRDITERIRAEEETAVQSTITAHLTEGIMLVRASDDIIVYVNPTMRKMFGYDEDEMVGMPVWDLNSGDDGDQKTISRAIVESVKETGGWQGEIHNKRKSGERFWTYASTTTIDHYEHGLVYLSTQVDITDRKQMEQELILQGAIARNLSESVNLVRASDQAIVYTNDRFDELFGYEPGEMIGRPVTELNPPPPEEGKPRISDLYMRQVEADGHWQGEILNVRKDGSQFWTLASIAQIEHPEHGKVYIATRVDITDRVEATNSLESALARLDHLISSMNVVVYTFATTEGFPTTYISDSTERIMGYPASRFLEDPMFYRQNVHPDDYARLTELVFDPDLVEQVLEYRYHRGDGEWIWLQDHIRMLTDETGQIVEGIGVKVDITEARKAQEDLNRAVRLAAGGEVAAGVAHQINNPLTIILAQASLLKQDIPPGSKLQSSLDIILRAIERAGKVVQRLLYMSKVLPYDYEYVDLHQTIESTAALVMAQFEAEQGSIVMDFASDMPPIWASESHLQDVWLNILINARDAVKVGEPLSVTIRTRLIDEGENVQVRIQDDGPGIAKENLDSIFLPLYTTKPQHTGLGLPFCIEVVTRHGGIMEVDSALGQGAAFIITLPVKKGQESDDTS